MYLSELRTPHHSQLRRLSIVDKQEPAAVDLIQCLSQQAETAGYLFPVAHRGARRDWLWCGYS